MKNENLGEKMGDFFLKKLFEENKFELLCFLNKKIR